VTLQPGCTVRVAWELKRIPNTEPRYQLFLSNWSRVGPGISIFRVLQSNLFPDYQNRRTLDSLCTCWDEESMHTGSFPYVLVLNVCTCQKMRVPSSPTSQDGDTGQVPKTQMATESCKWLKRSCWQCRSQVRTYTLSKGQRNLSSRQWCQWAIGQII
jgi:hypothetical protein